MGKTWVPNTTNRQQLIGGRLVNPGDGAFVDSPDPTAATPVQVQGQLNTAGQLELVAGGQRHRAMTPVAAAAFDSLVSGAGNGVSFLGKFLGSAVPTVGPVPTSAVNAGATAVPTIFDYRGRFKYCKLAERRHAGARRVENLLRASNAFDNSTYWTVVGTATIVPITTDAARTIDSDGTSYKTCYRLTGDGTTSNVIKQTLGVLPAVKHTLSIDVWGGTAAALRARAYVSGGATFGEITPAGGNGFFQRYTLTFTPDGTSAVSIMLCTTTSGYVEIRKAQLEDMSTEPDDANGNRPPSEYVSQDEIVYSAGQNTPYHGAFVDGVKYFETTNGNTVNNSTKVVTEAAGTAISESLMLGANHGPQFTNLVTNGDTLSGWTINSATSLSLTTGQPSPDGRSNAILLTEDTNFTSKFVSFAATVADNSALCAQAIFEQPPSGAAQFARIDIKKKDGTTVVCSFDLAAGTMGNQAAVTAAGGKSYMWQFDGRWWCSLVVNVGTGGTTPEIHLGIMGSATATTYTGTGKSLRVWNPHMVAKEHPCVFAKAASTTQTRTGFAEDVATSGLIGLNNFAIYAEITLLCDSGIGGKTTDGVTQSWYYPFYMRAQVPDQAHHRCGQSIRPFTDGVTGYALFAQDRYLGNVVNAYKWQPNTYYPAGAWVVPTTVQVDNANAVKQFRNYQAGTSGATEPSWNSTWVSPEDGGVANITTDGGCRWQASHQNRISGNFENYDGFLTLANVPAMTPMRIVNWYSNTPTVDMGSAVNGVLGYRQTEPFPILPGSNGNLVKPMSTLRFGRATTTYPVAEQFTRYVTIWDNPPDNNASTWVPLSATGNFA